MREEHKEVMKLVNVTGVLTKVTSKADKLAMYYGILADPIADGRGLSGAPAFAMDRLGKWKIPDLTKIVEMVQHYPQYAGNIKNAAYLYIGGELLETIGQGKWGKTAKKAGWGLLKGVAIGAALWLPAINPHGASSSLGLKLTGQLNGAIGNPLENEYGA